MGDASSLLADQKVNGGCRAIRGVEAPPDATLVERVVCEIRSRIFEATRGLTASAGIGPNRLLAKIASGNYPK